MMSEASTGVDAEMRPLTLAVWGVFQERSRACWDAPRRQTRRKERKTPENPTLFFLGSLSRDRHIFLRFKLALSCGFLNWAAGSRLLPHRPMFCTSFDFEKNKGLFLLALITVVLNFQFFPKS